VQVAPGVALPPLLAQADTSSVMEIAASTALTAGDDLIVPASRRRLDPVTPEVDLPPEADLPVARGDGSIPRGRSPGSRIRT
jgi:hypothetical protein